MVVLFRSGGKSSHSYRNLPFLPGTTFPNTFCGAGKQAECAFSSPSRVGGLRPARPPAHIRVRLQGSGGSGDKSREINPRVHGYKDSDSLRRSRRTHPLSQSAARPSRHHVCVQLQGSDWSGEKTVHSYKDSASCAAAAQPTWPQLPLGPVETKLSTVTRNRGTSNFTCAQLQGSGKQRAIFAYGYTDPIDFELFPRTVTGKWSLGAKICAQLQESAFSRNHISE